MSQSISTATRARRALAVLPLLLGLAACATDEPSTSDLISTEPTIDEGDIGGHDETVDDGGSMNMCLEGATDCVDVVIETDVP